MCTAGWPSSTASRALPMCQDQTGAVQREGNDDLARACGRGSEGYYQLVGTDDITPRQVSPPEPLDWANVVPRYAIQ